MHVEFYEGLRTKSDGEARWPGEYEAYKPSKPAEPVAVEAPRAKSKK